jgi:hypothetical protein
VAVEKKAWLMVDKKVQPLLALGLEGLERAKRLFVFRLLAHSAALVLAMMAALFVEDPDSLVLEVVAAAAAIGFETLALLLHHWAADLHSRSRQVMRRVMILDALNPEQAPVALERSRAHFNETVLRGAADLQARDQHLDDSQKRLLNYYYSRKPWGQARLRDHLFESAIFSHHLYRTAWKFSLLCLVLLLAGAAIVVGVLVLGRDPTHHHSLTSLVVRLLIALVAFVPASQEVDHLLLYREVEHQLAGLLKRVEALYANPLNEGEPNSQLLADLGDYCAATTFAPPIRTLVYKALVDRLVVEFEQKMKQLNQSEPEA